MKENTMGKDGFKKTRGRQICVLKSHINTFARNYQLVFKTYLRMFIR